MKPELRQLSRFPFTKRSIEALPAHDADSRSREGEYTDSETIGLKLRVSKSGRRFFQHRYRYLGRKKCMTLGEFPHVTLQEARKRVSENKALLARDIDPSEERQHRRNELNLEEFVVAYYLPEAHLRKKTVQNDIYRLKSRILPAMGKLRLSSITARDITAFHAKERERNSATSANQYLALLKTILTMAVRLSMLEKSPAGFVNKYKQPPPRDRYLSREELPRFLSALEEMGDTLPAAIIKIALYSGLRRAEVTGLKWENVQLGEPPHLNIPLTKNGKSHVVPLSSKALEVMKGLASRCNEKPLTRNSEYVFPLVKEAKDHTCSTYVNRYL